MPRRPRSDKPSRDIGPQRLRPYSLTLLREHQENFMRWPMIASAIALLLWHSQVKAQAAVFDPPDPTVSPMRGIIERYTADLGSLDRRYELPGSDAARKRLGRLYQDRLHVLDNTNFDAL